MPERVELQQLVYSFGVDTKPLEKGTRDALDVIKRSSNQVEAAVQDTAKRVFAAFRDDPSKALDAVAEGIENAIRKLGFAGQVAAGVLVGVGAASAEAIKVAAAAQALINTSQTLQISAQHLQQFDLAASSAGVPLQTFRGALQQANQALAEFKDGTANDSIKKAFANLGVSQDQAAQWKNIGDAWDTLMSKLDKLPEGKRGQTVADLGLTQALPVINQGIDSYRALIAEAQKFHGFLSDDDIARNAAAAKTMNETAQIIKGQFTNAFKDLAPWVAENSKHLLALTDTVAKFVKGIVDSIPALFHWSTYFKTISLLAHGDFKGAGDFLHSLGQSDEKAAAGKEAGAADRYRAVAGGGSATHPPVTPHAAPHSDYAETSKRINELLDTAEKARLEALAALTQNIEERAKFESAAVDAELKKELDVLEAEQKKVDADKTITAAQKKELDLRIASAALADAAAAESKKQLIALKAMQERQTYDLQLAQELGTYQDAALTAQASLAKTLQQRADLELQVFRDEQNRTYEKKRLDDQQAVQTGKMTQGEADADLHGLSSSQQAQLVAERERQKRQVNPLYNMANPQTSLADDAQALEAGEIGKLGGMLGEIATKSETAKAAFHDMVQGIIQDLVQLAVKRAIEQPLAGALFGAQNGSGNSFAAPGVVSLGSAAPALFGAQGAPLAQQASPSAGLLGSIFGGIGHLFGFAAGGEPPVGKASVVGEKGPELFVPKQPGTVIPNDMLGRLGGRPMTSVAQTTYLQQFHLHAEGAVMTDELLDNFSRRADAIASSRAQQAGAAAYQAARRDAPGWSAQFQAEQG